MSGPIVRKYGFPNHDQIFGSKPLQHGVEDDETPEGSVASEKTTPSKSKVKPKANKPKSKKG
jgi:hypothetical protein